MALQDTDNFIVSDTSGTNYKLSYASLLAKLQADGVGSGGGDPAFFPGFGQSTGQWLGITYSTIDYRVANNKFESKNKNWIGNVNQSGDKEMRFTFENGSMIGGFRSIQDYSGSGASHIMTFNDISSFEGEIVGSWAKNAGGGAQVNGNNVGFIVGGTTPADVALAITNSYLQSIPGVGAPGTSSYGYNLSNFNVNTNGKVPFSSLSSGAQSKYNAVVALSKSYA